MNKYSRLITQIKDKSPAQSMLYALGLTKKDLSKPQIGVGSVFFQSNPCNARLNLLSQKVSKGLYNKNFIPMEFSSIGVSDGKSMGTTGMRYSLPSRELIADSFESICQGEHYDGLVTIAGCDKNLPGVAMALFRLNRPGLIIYGGSMRPSYHKGKKLDIVSSFESYGKYLQGDITNKQREEVVKNSCDKKCGSCSGFYTANTMACLLEVMGLTLPNSSSHPSMSLDKFTESLVHVPNTVEYLIKNDIKPLDIVNRESFINAIKMLYLIGGSTNAVIHLLAMARTADIELSLEDFKEYEHYPVLCDMKPHGEKVMHDLYISGGMRGLFNYFIDNEYINGDMMTVNGKTLKENCEGYFLKDGIIKKMKRDSHIKILGNSFKCVLKIYSDQTLYSGKAIVFDDEKCFLKALKEDKIEKYHFIIIRYQGETIGCPEMLTPTSALKGYFGDDAPPLATDGRFSGGSSGILIAHLPDAYKKGSIAVNIKNGDYIEINLKDNSININTTGKNKNKKIKLEGYLRKYSKLVTGLEDGFLC